MKKFFKGLAVLVIIIHVVAALFYTGIIPVQLFANLRLPDAGRLAEFILRLNNEGEAEETSVPVEEDAETKEGAAEGAEDGEETAAPEEQAAAEEEPGTVQIELSENLPDLTEEDLYDLPRVLTEAGALKAAGPQGEDLSDQIVCELAADIENPGHFTAVFSVQSEDGQIQRGPSADMQVEMTAPFLAFREDDLTIPVGTDYDPYRNILICMDIDGTVLTEFVEHDGYLNTAQAGDYELRFYIYSRVTASSAFRTMRIHVE